MEKGLSIFVALLFFASMSMIYSYNVFPPDKVRILYPIETYANSDSVIELPPIAPGQTMRIEIYPRVDTGGINGIGGYYQSVKVSGLPPDWLTQESKDYSNPLVIFITVSGYALERDYLFNVTLSNDPDYVKLGNFTVQFSVNVNKSILSAWVEKQILYAYASRQISERIYVKNLGNYDEYFIISFRGEKLTPVTSDLLLRPQETKAIDLTLLFNDPEIYYGEVIVYPKSNPLIAQKFPLKIIVSHSIKGELKSIRNGVLIFPHNIFYSLMCILEIILSYLNTIIPKNFGVDFSI